MKRGVLLLVVGAVGLVGCGKKKPKVDPVMEAYDRYAALMEEDLEAAADSMYALYQANKDTYKNKKLLRTMLFLSANWTYACLANVENPESPEGKAEMERILNKAIPRYMEFIKTYPTSLDPDVGEAYKELGYCLFQLKRYEDVVNLMEEAKRAAPDSPYLPWFYKYEGRALTFLDKKSEAIANLKEAYRLFDAQAIPPERDAVKEDLKKLGVPESEL